jgi:hypothetical protein
MEHASRRGADSPDERHRQHLGDNFLPTIRIEPSKAGTGPVRGLIGVCMERSF